MRASPGHPATITAIALERGSTASCQSRRRQGWGLCHAVRCRNRVVIPISHLLLRPCLAPPSLSAPSASPQDGAPPGCGFRQRQFPVACFWLGGRMRSLRNSLGILFSGYRLWQTSRYACGASVIAKPLCSKVQKTSLLGLEDVITRAFQGVACRVCSVVEGRHVLKPEVIHKTRDTDRSLHTSDRRHFVIKQPRLTHDFAGLGCIKVEEQGIRKSPALRQVVERLSACFTTSNGCHSCR